MFGSTIQFERSKRWHVNTSCQSCDVLGIHCTNHVLWSHCCSLGGHKIRSENLKNITSNVLMNTMTTVNLDIPKKWAKKYSFKDCSSSLALNSWATHTHFPVLTSPMPGLFIVVVTVMVSRSSSLFMLLHIGGWTASEIVASHAFCASLAECCLSFSLPEVCAKRLRTKLESKAVAPKKSGQSKIKHDMCETLHCPTWVNIFLLEPSLT